MPFIRYQSRPRVNAEIRLKERSRNISQNGVGERKLSNAKSRLALSSILTLEFLRLVCKLLLRRGERFPYLIRELVKALSNDKGRTDAARRPGSPGKDARSHPPACRRSGRKTPWSARGRP